jgi:hypothetical protein
MSKQKHSDYTPAMSRRTILKGLGATLALPWLESLAFAAGDTALKPPRRYIAMFFANGVNAHEWWAKGNENAIEDLSPTLAPLADFRQEFIVLNGLRIFDSMSGVHWPYFTNLLSSGVVEKGAVPDCAESADQFIAKRIGDRTTVPGMNLGIEPTRAGLRLGMPDVIWGTFSWRDKSTPVPAEIYPRQAFDRLFDASGLARDKSVLDTVLEQSKAVGKDLGTQDRLKLEEYMQSIREVETRIERASSDQRKEGDWRPELKDPDMERPSADVPASTPEHMKLMLDIMLLALQMDKTRVCTFLFNRDSSNMLFDFIEGVEAKAMHGGISHHNNVPSVLAEYQKVNQFHVEQLAYVLGKMRGVDEGGSSLLDNSMLLFGSSMMDGNTHNANGIPLLLCGGGGGSIRSGRVLTYEKDEDRRLCNLHLSMINRMGVETDSFGNSHYPLPGLA